MIKDEKIYSIAISLIEGIGPVTARKLIQQFGSAAAVFQYSKKQLIKEFEVPRRIAEALTSKDFFDRAEQEFEFAVSNGIEIIGYEDSRYPKRLKHCYDCPVVLYYKGNADLNSHKFVSIIGTRKATDYGKNLTENFIAEIAAYDVVIVSGLAYGIDIIAHKAALEHGLPTIGVLGHGLDKLYPSSHKNTAMKMLESGGMLSEFPSGTKPDRENFPLRNRVVAGMCDAAVVIESGIEGGSMITAEFANNYNREVFAFPGNAGNPYSAGCNKLIRTHKAALIENAGDFIEAMGWRKQGETEKGTINEKKRESAACEQRHLLLPASADESKIVEVMQGAGNIHIDEITTLSGYAPGKVSALLLQLEFSGLVKSLPGKMFRLQ
ncbi:MAG: DNA-processing protein DprA [Bacteroidia bacterium]